jgi:hypothetical protein
LVVGAVDVERVLNTAGADVDAAAETDALVVSITGDAAVTTISSSTADRASENSTLTDDPRVTTIPRLISDLNPERSARTS